MEDKTGQNKIDFHCEFGMWPFKKTFDISASGFQFCGEMFPLNTVTRLRWGKEVTGTKIFPNTRFVAAFGTETREIAMHIKEKKLYEEITDHIWNTTGKRLLAKMFAGLKSGKSYKFGTFTANDNGIAVTEGENAKHYRWAELKWAIVDENLVFMPAEGGEKLIASASLANTDNAHVLSIALALLQKNGTAERLSSAE